MISSRQRLHQEYGIFVEAAFAVPVIIAIFLFSIYVGLILIVKGVANDAAVQGLTLATSHPDLMLIPNDYQSSDYCDSVEAGDKFCDAVKEIEAQASAASSVGLIGPQGGGTLASYAGPPRLLLPNPSEYASVEEAFANEPIRLSMDINIAAPLPGGSQSFTLNTSVIGYYELSSKPSLPAKVDCNGYPFTHSKYQTEPCDCTAFGPNFAFDPVTFQCVDCGEFHFADPDNPNVYPGRRLPNGCFCPSHDYCESFANDDSNNLATAVARDPQGDGVYGECGCECRWSAHENGRDNIEDCACGEEPSVLVGPHDENYQATTWQALGYGVDYGGDDWFFGGDGSNYRIPSEDGESCECNPKLDNEACQALYSNAVEDGQPILMSEQGLGFRLIAYDDGCYCYCGSVCPDGAIFHRGNNKTILPIPGHDACLCECESERKEIDLTPMEGSERGRCVCKEAYGEERCLDASPNFQFIEDTCDCVCSDAQVAACAASGGGPPDFNNFCQCTACPNGEADENGIFRCEDAPDDDGVGG